MKRALTALVLVLATVTPAAAVAQPPVDAPSAGTSPTVTHTPTPIVASQPPNPRVKLSYVRFSIGNVDGSAVPLDGLHLDLYPLSRRWIRGGFELEAGRGQLTLLGTNASVKYGLAGLNAGFQLPGRVTPFVEGRLAGGVIGGSTNQPIMIPGTGVTMQGASAATWIYGRGLDAGAEFYLLGRTYVSVALGWLRTTWGNADYTAMVERGAATIRFSDVTHDSFLLKIGLGF